MRRPDVRFSIIDSILKDVLGLAGVISEVLALDKLKSEITGGGTCNIMDVSQMYQGCQR